MWVHDQERAHAPRLASPPDAGTRRQRPAQPSLRRPPLAIQRRCARPASGRRAGAAVLAGIDAGRPGKSYQPPAASR